MKLIQIAGGKNLWAQRTVTVASTLSASDQGQGAWHRTHALLSRQGLGHTGFLPRITAPAMQLHQTAPGAAVIGGQDERMMAMLT